MRKPDPFCAFVNMNFDQSEDKVFAGLCLVPHLGDFPEKFPKNLQKLLKKEVDTLFTF